MPRLEQPRVFHKAALSELEQQSTALLECASDVTEGLREILLELRAAADAVPEEAKDPGLPAAINALLAGLSTESYDQMKNALSAVLNKLMENIPLYDRLSAGVLKDLGLAAGAVSLMIGDLMSLIDEGSLRLSQEDFLGRLNECESRWEAGLLRLEKQMELAMTYLKGYTDNCLYGGDPVNLSTGNFYYDKEDLTLRGILPISLHRYYNALDKERGSLGNGWSHSYETHLEKKAAGEEAESVLILHRADGREATFKKEADGIYRDIHTGREEIRIAGAKGETKQDPKEEPKEELEPGVRYTYTDAEKQTHEFREDGKRIRISDQNGNALRLNYTEEGKLKTVTEEPAETAEENKAEEENKAAESRRSLSFCYDKEGYLRSVKDHSGRSIEYFCVDGSLSEVTDAEGNRVCYRYGENGKIRAIKNAGGILSVRNEYDEKNRILRQQFPDGSQMSYTYEESARKVILTDRNHSQIIYEHDERMRKRRTIYHNGEESYTYNDKDQKTSYTDRNGNTTRYAYDNQGNLSQVLSASGEKTNLTYNAQGKLLSVKINGVTTVKNSYDHKGNLIKTEDALGRIRAIRYNNRGQAEAIEQADGSVLDLSYDKAGNLQSITDPYGGTRGYAYDELNRVIRTTDAMGNPTSYAYNQKDQLIEETNAEGKSRRYTYNESGKVTKVEDYDGSTSETTYNRLNKAERIRDKEGREIELSYDAMWNIAGETLPTGAEIQYRYDVDNRLIETKVYAAKGEGEGTAGETTAGETSTEGKAAEGKKAEENREKAISILTNRYDKAGNLILTEGGSEGEVLTRTSYTYDALNRKTSVTDAEGNTTHYAYDAEGRLSTIIDPNGNRYTNEYNEAGELIKETGPDGNSISYTYNALGKRASRTDALFQTTTYHYEAGGRLKKISYPNNREIHYRYDLNGNLIEQKQTSKGKAGAEGTEGNTEGKTAGNTEGKTAGNAAGDAAGEETSILSYTYDCMNRVTAIKSNHGQKKSYRYDAVGNLVSVTDANGNTTAYGYTKSGKLKSVTDALGNTTEYGYDALDQLIRIDQYGEGERKEGEADRTNPTAALRHTDYLRNSLGQLLCVKDALGNEEHYTYDGLGRVLSKQDKDGYETTYRYTGTGEIKSIRYGDKREVELSYDALRKLTQVKDWLGTTNIENDLLGRVIKITDHKERTLKYEWGSFGERTGIRYPDGTKAVYTYKEAMRLAHIREYRSTDGGIKAQEETIPTLLKSDAGADYTYDEKGRLSGKQYPNGIKTTYLYDPQGHLLRLTHEDAQGVLDRYQYAYDNMGNKTAVTKERRGLSKESGRYEYGYDALSRLETVTKDGKTVREYHYDAFGNRDRLIDHSRGEEVVYHYNAINQLLREERQTWTGSPDRDRSVREPKNLQPQTKSYTYDRRGNLIKEMEEGIETHAYHYDALNRLAEAQDRAGNRASYEYNGLGQRTGERRYEAALPGSMEQEQSHAEFLLDLTKPYHNLLWKEEGGRRQRYLWDQTVLGMTDMEIEDGEARNGEAGNREAGNREAGKREEPSYYLQDELGSPIRLLYQNGEIRESYGYDEYGNELDNPASYAEQGSYQPFGYTGYRKDRVAGSYFAQAREYRPGIGRFLGEDWIKGSLVSPITMNRYGYCWSNPLKLVDLNGLNPSAAEDERTGYVYYIEDFESQAEWQIKQLEKQGYEVVAVDLAEEAKDRRKEDIAADKHLAMEFMDQWNGMPDQVDVAYVFCHGDERMLQFRDESSYNALTLNGKNKKDDAVAGNLHDLDLKSIGELYLQACNAGHIDALFMRKDKENVASVLSQRVKDGVVYAWDGSVGFHFFFSKQARLSKKQSHFEWLIEKENYPTRRPLGQVKYKNGEPIDNVYYEWLLFKIQTSILYQNESCSLN